MPSLATLQAFAATVESNDHVGAIRKFYAPDAQTRENNNPPIAGRDALAEKERRVLASVAGVETTRLGPLFLDGDHSAICWRFEFTRKDGTQMGDGGDGAADLARRASARGALLLRSEADAALRRSAARHGRACPGHPRFWPDSVKTWSLGGASDDEAVKKWPGLLPAIFIFVARLSAAARCRAAGAAARPGRR